jgi:ArsR family transcriptional regulator
MNGENALADMETFFMALADKTRLRLLNLMRDEEVCVCFFTEVLGDSQPKISRHLAYLRNAGIVEARRDGKWMHYSITRPNDEGGQRVLEDLFEWLDSREEMRADREKYTKVCCTPEMLVQIARTPITFISPHADMNEIIVEFTASHNELEEFLL